MVKYIAFVHPDYVSNIFDIIKDNFEDSTPNAFFSYFEKNYIKSKIYPIEWWNYFQILQDRTDNVSESYNSFSTNFNAKPGFFPLILHLKNEQTF